MKNSKIIFFILFCFVLLIKSDEVILPYNDSSSILKFVKKILPENPIILEAGSFDGNDTLEMNKLWPNSKIYCFEPIPELFNKLIRNTEKYKNINCYNLALSDKNGTSIMHVSEDTSDSGQPTGSSSLLSPKEHLIFSPGAIFNKKIEVETITINDWAKINNIKNIDFIWLDTQGTELNILMNSENILQNVKIIVTEVEFVEAYAGQYLFKDVKKWLENQGFELIAKNFDSEKAYWFGDAIFINKNLK